MADQAPRNRLLDAMYRQMGGARTYNRLADTLPTANEIATIHENERRHWGEPVQNYYRRPVDIFGPEQHYDHVAALRSNMQTGLDPESGTMHGSSEFKDDTHPNRFVYDRELGHIIDSKTGEAWRYEPGTPEARLVLQNMLKRLSEQ